MTNHRQMRQLDELTAQLQPAEVTRLAVGLLQRCIAAAADESLKPTEQELDACARAVGGLPQRHLEWHMKVFDRAQAALLEAAWLRHRALIALQVLELTCADLASLQSTCANDLTLAALHLSRVTDHLRDLVDASPAHLASETTSFGESLQLCLFDETQCAILDALKTLNVWAMRALTTMQEHVRPLLTQAEVPETPGPV